MENRFGPGLSDNVLAWLRRPNQGGRKKYKKHRRDVVESFLGSESESGNEDSDIEPIQTDILCDWDDWFENL